MHVSTNISVLEIFFYFSRDKKKDAQAAPQHDVKVEPNFRYCLAQLDFFFHILWETKNIWLDVYFMILYFLGMSFLTKFIRYIFKYHDIFKDASSRSCSIVSSTIFSLNSRPNVEPRMKTWIGFLFSWCLLFNVYHHFFLAYICICLG